MKRSVEQLTTNQDQLARKEEQLAQAFDPGPVGLPSNRRADTDKRHNGEASKGARRSPDSRWPFARAVPES
jgi:hypothetical protein